jgi:two-component system, LytTR family, response regulator
MSVPIRVLVVDDEPLARAGMISLLGRDPEVVVVGECGDGAQAIAGIGRLAPDLVLLDVQMPEADGFEVLRAVGADQMPAVVFVTAYDRFAVRAFEVNAVDYLLKPFDDERFSAALERAKQTVRQGPASVGEVMRRLARLLDEAPTPSPGRRLTRLIVKDQGRATFLGVDELVWIEAADYYVKLHTPGKTYLLRQTLQSLEERLDPTHFFRVHRSALVNLDRVKEVQALFKGDHVVILHDGTRLKLSRTRKDSLEALLGQSL